MQCHRSGFLFFAILSIVPSSSYGDWFYFSGTGHYYGLTDARLNWAEAETQAVAMGGHLASILTQEEQDFLVKTFVNPASPGGERQPFWICGTDQADEGTFVLDHPAPLGRIWSNRIVAIEKWSQADSDTTVYTLPLGPLGGSESQLRGGPS